MPDPKFPAVADFTKEAIRLVSGGSVPEQVHRFEENDAKAILAALAARRPLLVRGEPGVGKTQFALAAAYVLKRAFVPFTVDSRTESRDLLWSFDAVARLADAQANRPSDELAAEKYVRPGPLWWAFDWEGAKTTEKAKPPKQHDWGDPANGCVVLIDEIDKAELDVPNGLLEALGSGRFEPTHWKEAVQVGAVPPLVVVTTNEERTLPNAFVRRCLEYRLELPKDRDALVKRLVARAKDHFPTANDDLFKTAAEAIAAERAARPSEPGRPAPGQAEYLDLLRAAIELGPRWGKSPEKVLESIQGFFLRGSNEDRS